MMTALKHYYVPIVIPSQVNLVSLGRERIVHVSDFMASLRSGVVRTALVLTLLLGATFLTGDGDHLQDRSTNASSPGQGGGLVEHNLCTSGARVHMDASCLARQADDTLSFPCLALWETQGAAPRRLRRRWQRKRFWYRHLISFRGLWFNDALDDDRWDFSADHHRKLQKRSCNCLPE